MAMIPPPALAVNLLKADLGFFSAPLDADMEAYLRNLLIVADGRLSEEAGLTLDASDVKDCQLCVMYAAWLYRKRDAGTGKPPMLQTAIRERQISHATAKEMRS